MPLMLSSALRKKELYETMESWKPWTDLASTGAFWDGVRQGRGGTRWRGSPVDGVVWEGGRNLDPAVILDQTPIPGPHSPLSAFMTPLWIP